MCMFPEQNLVWYYKVAKLQNNTSIVRISSEQDQISTTTVNFPSISKYPSNQQLLRREFSCIGHLFFFISVGRTCAKSSQGHHCKVCEFQKLLEAFTTAISWNLILYSWSKVIYIQESYTVQYYV